MKVVRTILATPPGEPVRLASGAIVPPEKVREVLAAAFVAGAALSDLSAADRAP